MKQSFKILLVEDTESFRDAVTQLIGVYNEIDGVGSIVAAREALKKQTYDVVILDKNLPDGSGPSLIPEIKDDNPGAVVIMLTVDSDFASVKRCIAAGADDYVVKSPNVIPDLLVRIPLAAARAASEKRMTALEEQVKEAFKYEIIGRSLSTAELREKISSLKGTSSHVLVTGESGTGKELIARRLNAIEGGPRTRPFIAINCSALPENLVESELFGHKKGSFTGAMTDKRGKFEEADGGDIFLDEIGDLPLAIQAKLLRVIQDGQFFRVGDSRPIQVECRVIAATNKNVEAEVRAGAFREDLYYRLNVVRIHTTPLRARKEDIPNLAQSFLIHCGGPGMTFSENAIKRLEQHEWPGNIRELRNAIERAVISSRYKKSSRIEFEDISIHQGLEHAASDLRQLEIGLPTTIEELSSDRYRNFLALAERAYFREALGLVNGNAAELGPRLGLARSTVFKKISDLSLARRAYGTKGASKSDEETMVQALKSLPTNNPSRPAETELG